MFDRSLSVWVQTRNKKILLFLQTCKRLNTYILLSVLKFQDWLGLFFRIDYWAGGPTVAPLAVFFRRANKKHKLCFSIRKILEGVRNWGDDHVLKGRHWLESQLLNYLCDWNEICRAHLVSYIKTLCKISPLWDKFVKSYTSVNEAVVFFVKESIVYK